MDAGFAGGRRPHRPRAALLVLLLAAAAGSAAAQDGTHVVRPGDTLSAIARLYDSTVQTLREENGLASDLLRVGDVLRVASADAWRSLAAGDDETWPALARTTGISEATLRAANPGVPTPAGHDVRVPPADGPLAWPREGEDLVALAARLGVSPGRLATVNGLEAPYELSTERPLVLPEPVPTGSGTTPFAGVPAAAAVDDPNPAPDGPERRAAHAALRSEVLAGLGGLLQGRVLSPPDDGFTWPLAEPPRLTSTFGWRNVSVGGNRYHQGIDLGAATGTPVRAARGGVVVRAAWIGAYGYAVYLSHEGGYETRYAHLSRVSVRVGQVVATGEEVGAVGSTGASTGPHLHFEARLDGRALDPLAVLPRLP